jgi:hypothetical protein
MMAFDATISLGNLLTIVAMVGSVYFFIMTMRGDLRVLGQRLTSVEVGMAQVTLALVQLAKQEARLDAHADRISRIEQERKP